MIESSAGAFEVEVDGQRVFSKLESGRFPGYREIPDLVVKGETVP